MKTLVKLTQENKAGNVSFEARKQFYQSDNETYTDLSNIIADFCTDVKELAEKNAKVGYNNLNLKIKKTLPLVLTFESDEDDPITLKFRNFGKFLEGTTRKQLSKFFENNIEFTYKWSNYEVK